MSSLFAQHAAEEEKEGVKRNLQRLPDSQSVILLTGKRKLRLKSCKRRGEKDKLRAQMWRCAVSQIRVFTLTVMLTERKILNVRELPDTSFSGFSSLDDQTLRKVFKMQKLK